MDNPIPGIDPELFTERVTNTSARAGPSTHPGYQPRYAWVSPLRDIQPGIFNPETTSNPEDNPISGIDPELFTERATNSSARAGLISICVKFFVIIFHRQEDFRP